MVHEMYVSAVSYNCSIPQSQSCVVYLATMLRAGQSTVEILVGVREFFLLQNCPDRLWSPCSLLFDGYQDSFPGRVKQPGREVNHSPPSTVEVKNEWSFTSASPICHCGVDREDFTITFFVPYLSPVHFLDNKLILELKFEPYLSPF